MPTTVSPYTDPVLFVQDGWTATRQGKIPGCPFLIMIRHEFEPSDRQLEAYFYSNDSSLMAVGISGDPVTLYTKFVVRVQETVPGRYNYGTKPLEKTSSDDLDEQLQGSRKLWPDMKY